MNNNKTNVILDVNSFCVNTPQLMSIPPKSYELESQKKYKEELLKEGKIEITVCCNVTRDFIIEALNLGITFNELNILKEALLMHPLDQFRGNKHLNNATNAIDIDALIEEVFEISTFFSNEVVSKYFIEEFYNLVQKENSDSNWSIMLAKFNKKWKVKLSEWEW